MINLSSCKIRIISVYLTAVTSSYRCISLFYHLSPSSISDPHVPSAQQVVEAHYSIIRKSPPCLIIRGGWRRIQRTEGMNFMRQDGWEGRSFRTTLTTTFVSACCLLYGNVLPAASIVPAVLWHKSITPVCLIPASAH